MKFIKGMELSRLYYKGVVKGIIEKEFPKLEYSAGLMDYGSEILGFDTEMSSDHWWGPRLIIFLTKSDFKKNSKKISEKLSQKLPIEFMGYPTNFSKAKKDEVRCLKKIKSGKVNHLIRFVTIESFFLEHLGFDINKKIEVEDWLVFSQQKLRLLQDGKIFYDDLKVKDSIKRFEYYPRDVWLYLMACEWQRISEEKAFVGRCGDTDNEIGSRIIATRITESIMRLCFLMEKKYMPYSKWFGLAFNHLEAVKEFSGVLEDILNAKNWKKREQYLSKAYILLIDKHNSLKVTENFPTKVQKYYDRPYLTIPTGKLIKKLQQNIETRWLREFKLIGSMDQVTNFSIILENDKVTSIIKQLYK